MLVSIRHHPVQEDAHGLARTLLIDLRVAPLSGGGAGGVLFRAIDTDPAGAAAGDVRYRLCLHRPIRGGSLGRLPGYQECGSRPQHRVLQRVFLRMHPEVEQVERFLMGYGAWRRPDGGAVSITIIGVDTRTQALALARRIPASLRAALDEPDTIVVDVSDLEKLQVRIGSRAEVNGRTVKVVGTMEGFRAIGGAYIFASLSTAQRLLDPTGRVGDETTYFLLKLAHPELTERVREQLIPAGNRQPYSVWEAHSFSVQSQLYWLFESGAGMGQVSPRCWGSRSAR